MHIPASTSPSKLSNWLFLFFWPLQVFHVLQQYRLA
uniref:Uncharacterized protein n=1 Tax=Rhizophora mucronata TaxID=61149 RepID=A0A2P2NZE9_RHIMU